MAESYDLVICGTGLVECILSTIFLQEGKKVLHIDRNSFYGGEGASLNLVSLWKLFRPGVEPPKAIGLSNEWNVDLIPKFVMSNGNLFKMLKKTGIDQYIEWKGTDSTYVYQAKQESYFTFSKAGPKILKVPSNEKEILTSELMGILEKNRCNRFFSYVQKYDSNNKDTHMNINLKTENFSTLIKKFNLSTNTVEFIGHAMCFYNNDNFIEKPAIETVKKVKSYLDCYNNETYPFLYSVHGVKGILEGFTKTYANYGATFWSGRDVDKIIYDDEGRITGISSNGQIANCKAMICHPSYMIKTQNSNHVQHKGRAVRCICILDHPIPNTDDDHSLHIIIPQKQVRRKSDISIVEISSVHQVCKPGYYIAVISTLVETDDPEKEIKPALDLLGNIVEKFITISDLYVPNPEFSDNIYVVKSSDPQSQFESVADNVIELYHQITGKDLDLTNNLQEGSRI